MRSQQLKISKAMRWILQLNLSFTHVTDLLLFCYKQTDNAAVTNFAFSWHSKIQNWCTLLAGWGMAALSPQTGKNNCMHIQIHTRIIYIHTHIYCLTLSIWLRSSQQKGYSQLIPQDKFWLYDDLNTCSCWSGPWCHSLDNTWSTTTF